MIINYNVLNKINRIVLKGILGIVAIICLSLLFSVKGYCENVTVVIDPGHGGDAMGGNYEDRIERDINLITALSMKERLEKYEGVDVYITRDNNIDKEMSRKQRFEFAKKVNADFLVSVHYNMSEYHTLYGSEVWVASKGINYCKGYAYAKLEMDSFTELGLFDRGIKNKLDKNKTGEYYGILKYAEDYNIPSVIVEHCHLDEERDSLFWNEDSYRKFGEIDADNMAKFFNLSSSELGIDNSSFVNITVDEPAERLDVDATDPVIEGLLLIDESDNEAILELTAYDEDTYVQYYQVSIDGGNSFGRLEAWEDRNSDKQIVTVDKTDKDIDVVIRVFNQYEYSATSENVLIYAAIIKEIEEPVVDNEVKTIETTIITTTKETNDEISPIVVLLVTMVVLFITFNTLFLIAVLSKRKKRKKVKKTVKKDEFDWDI